MSISNLLNFIFVYYKKNILIFFSLILVILILSYQVTNYYNKNKVFLNYSISNELSSIYIPEEYKNNIIKILSDEFINLMKNKKLKFQKINNNTVQIEKNFDQAFLKSSEIKSNILNSLNVNLIRKEKILKKLISINNKGDYRNEIKEIFFLKEVIQLEKFFKFKIYYEKSFKLNKLIFILICLFSIIFVAPFIISNFKKIIK
jgi:hypothetical protein